MSASQIPECDRSKSRLLKLSFWLACTVAATGNTRAGDLVETVAAVKPAIVAIATFQKTRSPATVFFGTGFAVADGLTIVTNAHVVLPQADTEKSGVIGILAGPTDPPQFRQAVVAAIDAEHDLAILKITGAPLPVMKLGDSAIVKEGQSLAFTGFPLGMVLGFHRATHQAMVAAVTPIVQPAYSQRSLDAKAIRQLQRSAFGIFQLDGTAYPGNSGSPLYDQGSGVVYGVINMVFVKGLKENAMSQPSGISYAIPSNYIRDLLSRISE